MIPVDITSLPGWLCWKKVPDGKRIRKVPYYVNGQRRSGVNGSLSDRAQLASYSLAVAQQDYDGVGLAMLPENNIVALDFDDCVVEGAIDPRVEALIADTYAEISPSGTGVRAFYLGSLPDAKDAHPEDGSFGLEVFCSAGYVTVTGNEIPSLVGEGVAPLSQGILDLYRERFGQRSTSVVVKREPLGYTIEDLREILFKIPVPEDNPRWFKIMCAVHHETRGSDDGRDLFDDWSKTGPGYDELSLRRRWEKLGRDGGTETTISHVLSLVPPTPDDFEVLPAIVEEPTDQGALRFESKPIGYLKLPDTIWRVQDLIPDAPLVLIAGESGAGKSFLTIDMTLHIARGLAWAGREVETCWVLYLAAEGHAGVLRRLMAYQRHYGLTDEQMQEVNFEVISEVPNLIQEGLVDLKALLAGAKRTLARRGWSGPGLVVLDTTAQVTAGANENSSEDMGLFLKACRVLSSGLNNSAVMPIIHVGKDATKGVRGWSGINAAADATITVEKKDRSHWLRVTKQKDGEDGQVIPFTLHGVNVGQDRKGNDAFSAVVNFDGAVMPVKEEKLWPLQRSIMEQLEALDRHSGPMTVTKLLSELQRVADREPVKEGEKPTKIRRSSVLESIESLVKKNKLVLAGDSVALVEGENDLV
jgi:RecA-family ATPase